MNANSQTAESDVEKTILNFFEGFHKQDSTLIKETVAEQVIMQTIGKNKEGKPVLQQEEFSKFISSILSIPKEKKFEEKLLSFHIQVDGDMAHAWTPYEFYLDGEFSHCGVNSFQLMKEDEGWKIIYIIDTRRREGCK